MAGTSREQDEWVDGFLFVGNHLALDFLNTKPILERKPTELLGNGAALERWLIASGMVKSQRDRALLRGWRDSREAELLVQKLIGFRECLRAAVLRVEGGSTPKNAFLAKINALLERYPPRSKLSKQGSKLVLKPSLEPRTPEDIWIPIIAATAELLSKVDPSRIRKCESESCVVHFYDTSKKGSRRWCSMNICGNRLKVAAYQKRQRRRSGFSP